MQDGYPSVRILLIRHAQARAADDSYDQRTRLSPLGERQAVATAQVLLGRGPPAAIYASPYPRCVETARPLCEALGQPPRLDERLREFEFDTCSLATVLSRPDLLIWDRSHRGKVDGETLSEFSTRVSRCLEEIAEQHLGSEVVLFTHSGVMDAAIRWLVGLHAEAAWMHDLPLANASITELDFWPRGRIAGGAPRYTAFLRIADTGHLSDCASDM